MSTQQTPGHCRNCHADIGNPPRAYCPDCGQDTSLHPPTLGEFAHEFIGHYIAFEGKLWHTLVQLFFKPGELTREYLRGRKQRYVLPLRLYLSASFVFFVLVSQIGGDTARRDANTDTGQKPAAVLEDIEQRLRAARAAPGVSAERAQLLAALEKELANSRDTVARGSQPGMSFADSLFNCNESWEFCVEGRKRIHERLGNMTREEVRRYLRGRIKSIAPYAVFLTLPVFALLMQLAYYRRRMYYGEHLVFALHLHAFIYFLLLIELAVPAVVKPILALAGLVYAAIAMQRVYGGRRWVLPLRYGVIALVYAALIFLVALLVILGAIFI